MVAGTDGNDRGADTDIPPNSDEVRENEDCDWKGNSQHASTIMIVRASEMIMVRNYVGAGFEMVMRGYRSSQ